MINLCYLRFLRSLLFIITLTAAIFFTLPQGKLAYAQSEADVTLKAQLGFDGYCKENGWLPIHVEVQNTGKDLNATVEVSYKNSGNGNTLTSQDLALPSGSRKEFFLYVYPQGYIRTLDVNLRSGQRVLKKTSLPITCLPAENMIFGVLADDPSTYDVLSEVKPLSGFARVAQLSLSDLPANAQAWGTLDALIISNVDTGGLTSQQKQALQSWLGTGGKLLVFGGVKWQGTVAGLADFLPIDVDSTTTVSALSRLQSYVQDSTPLEGRIVLAGGQPQEGAQILIQQDGAPLLAQKQMGNGVVYYFAADPALQPLREWSGMKDIYDHLLGFRGMSSTWVNGESFRYYEVSQALATIPELGLPSVFYICGLVVAYIAIIGPLNYFVLRRMKRRELAWVTIPALVVVFTGLAYGSGILYRGTTPILNRLAVVQAWDGMSEARAHGMVGIYSPVRARYDLQTTESFMISPLQGGDMSLQANNNWITQLQDTTMVMPGVQVEIGGMKPIALEGNIPALAIQHDLVITMDAANPIVSGDITNRSDHTLRGAFIVTPGQWKRLGDISPGESIPIDLSLIGSSSGPTFYTLSAIDILNVDYSDIETDVNLARQNAFLQTVLYSQYPLRKGNWGIYLIGWIDEPMLPVGLRDQRFKTIDTTLYIDMLSPSVNIGRGEWAVPVSLFKWESSNPNASPFYASGFPTGGYTLRFRPGFPIPSGEVKSLRLVLQSNALPGELMAHAWNYEEKEWSPISLTGGNTNIPDANQYIGPDHEVKIKVVSNRSDWTEITASYITLVVEP